uniref:HTH psq-type domain-containing protein n=1 Tax=Octopus bimaculoides TaxID=37653 RepID=A0A0L8FT06_OCTBM
MPKRKSYSVMEKLDLVDSIRNDGFKVKLSRETGIPESTLHGWVKDEANLTNYVNTVVDSEGLARKKARTATDS